MSDVDNQSLSNQFLTSAEGPGGTTVFAPTPLFTEEGLSPGVQQAGQAIGSGIAEASSAFLGQRFGGSQNSFLPILTERAFATGQQQALQAAAQQQSLFNQWAMLQNELALGAGPEQEDFDGGAVVSGALAGAGLGGAIGGPAGAGIGAGIGGGVGLLDQLLNLGLF
jgi:hypothetical protein